MAATAAQSEAIPAFVRDVIALYAEAMAEVSFPDLDLEVLESAAAQLRESAAAVQRAAEALEAARAAEHQSSESLVARAARALAYAKVFAAGDALLSERIAAIDRSNVAAPSDGARPKKRGRPRKHEAATGLFNREPSAGAPSLEVIASEASAS